MVGPLLREHGNMFVLWLSCEAEVTKENGPFSAFSRTFAPFWSKCATVVWPNFLIRLQRVAKVSPVGHFWESQKWPEIGYFLVFFRRLGYFFRHFSSKKWRKKVSRYFLSLCFCIDEMQSRRVVRKSFSKVLGAGGGLATGVTRFATRF